MQLKSGPNKGHKPDNAHAEQTQRGGQIGGTARPPPCTPLLPALCSSAAELRALTGKATEASHGPQMANGGKVSRAKGEVCQCSYTGMVCV